MTRHATPLSLAAAALALAGLSGCEALTETFARPFKKGDVGLERIETFVERVEAVHVEAEVSKQRSHETLNALAAMTDPAFAGDPLVAQRELAEAIAASEEQETALGESVDEMREAAGPYFDHWSEDMDAFSSAEMRERSRARLEDARARYQTILDAVAPARTDLREFNKRARDLTLFLGNDFNAASIAAVEGDVRDLTDEVAALSGLLDTCMRAAEDYVSSAAMPGRIESADEDAQAADATSGTR